jgi:DNA sulfur modification protein DndB
MKDSGNSLLDSDPLAIEIAESEVQQSESLSVEHDDDFYYFYATQGRQSGRFYWQTLAPDWMLASMFQSFLDRPPGKPLDMAQRTLSQSRASKIRKYATDARLADQFYIIPPIVVLADIPEDAEFWFEQYVDEDGGSVLLRPVGVLRLPIETSFSVADGQTRLAAIAAAAQQNANLFEGETLPMMILPDYGTAIKRQIFLDINQHACKPNKSLVSLFDHRDQISDVTREVMFAVKIFADFTALEAVNVSPKSGDLFTLNNLREANKLLLRGVKENQVQVATEYWKAVAKNILVWRQASRSSDRAQCAGHCGQPSASARQSSRSNSSTEKYQLLS